MATTEDFRMENGGSVLHLTFKKAGAAFSLVGATKLKIILKKKSEEILIKDAEIETTSGSGADGKVKYVFTNEDLNESGEWKAQGFARFSPTAQIYTSIVSFKVGENLTSIPADGP